MSNETATEHPYITRNPKFCGGSPRIRDSRLAVWLIAALWKAGDTVEDIIASYRHVPPAAIYDAISYYLDHRNEIEQEIANNRIENVLGKHGAVMDDRGVITLPTASATDGR